MSSNQDRQDGNESFSFLRAPRKDTRAYHPNAPKRSASLEVMSQSQRQLGESQRRESGSFQDYEANLNNGEPRKTSSGQRLAERNLSNLEQDLGIQGRMGYQSDSRGSESGESLGTTDSQLFDQIPWGGVIEGGPPTGCDGTFPRGRSYDTSSDEGPALSPSVAPGGFAAPPKLVFDTAHGGYEAQMALAVANGVLQDEPEEDGVFRQYIDEYGPTTKPQFQKSRRPWYDLACCFCLAAIGGIGIICIGTALAIPGSKRAEGNLTPISSPSTSVEATYLKMLATMVGDSVYNPNSHQERAARWIMYEDPMELGPYHPTLMQRYLLAAFYFATTDNISREWRSCNVPVDGGTVDCSFDMLHRRKDDRLSYKQTPSIRWLSVESECSWAGVICSDGHVHGIELTGQNMTGTLPVDLCSLPYLQILSLHNNAFTGTIPVEYARMRHVVNLNLHGNQLKGTIPNEIYQNDGLQHLNLGENDLKGTISTLLGQLTGLVGFRVGDNLFEGSIPSEIGQLKLLTHTRWDKNRFTGSLPSSIEQLTNLQELWVQVNYLTASLPSQLGVLHDMIDLQLYENRFSGSIPDELYDLLALLRLELSSNDLTGTISTRLGRLQQLTDFRVARNRLGGTIPLQLGSLENLRIIWLHMNQLEGSVPDSVCKHVGKGFLEYLNADCGPEESPANPCVCCTGCCDRTTEICLLTTNTTNMI